MVSGPDLHHLPPTSLFADIRSHVTEPAADLQESGPGKGPRRHFEETGDSKDVKLETQECAALDDLEVELPGALLLKPRLRKDF